MSSSTFTPADVVDMSKERDWPASLGMLDLDKTQIVFTKRTLLEFLKYVGVTVDTNFSCIQKLPRYARFGTLDASSNGIGAASVPVPSAPPASAEFRPSRRVRTAPGGTSSNIFGADDVYDALADAPTDNANVTAPSVVAQADGDVSTTPAVQETVQDTRPKSKRTTSSIASLWDAPTETDFKPTRRVRERPGGKDHIAELF